MAGFRCSPHARFCTDCRGEGVGVRVRVEVGLLAVFGAQLVCSGQWIGSRGESVRCEVAVESQKGVSGCGNCASTVESLDSKLPCCKLAMPDILIGCRRRGSLLVV